MAIAIYHFYLPSYRLLSDTELAKYIIQLILSGDLAGDLAKVVEAGADIEGYEIAGDIIVEAGLDVAE